MDSAYTSHRRKEMTNEDSRYVTVEETVSFDDAGLELRKLRTRQGSRVEIHDVEEGSRLRLDALGLERLSWLTRDALPVSSTRVFGEESGRAELFPVTNEFADVTLSKLEFDGADALEIRAPKLERATVLSTSDLRWMAGETMDLISALLETPYPEDDH